MSQKLRFPDRPLIQSIQKDLEKKMVFIGGPRQVGKTTLAQSLIPDFYEGHPAYLNWDDGEHREIIRNKAWPKNQRLIILDEIHKAKNWQTMVKGFYDTQKNQHQFLITGSARLDLYRRGGDSLLGRYHYYRLHPYCLTDFLPHSKDLKKDLESLFKYGGFPEPLLSQDDRELRRWHIGRVDKLIKNDLRDLERVSDLNKIELLAQALPERVGSPLSVKNLAEDLEIAPKTCKKWIEHLESLYYCFHVAPFGAPKIRAVKKEKKYYLWDWSQLEDEGLRFENMVASHLLKYCHALTDLEGYPAELRYLRDTEKREIDFIVVKNRKPILAVECKLSEQPIADSLSYFEKRVPMPKYVQVFLNPASKLSQRVNNPRSCSFLDFIKTDLSRL